MLGAEGTNARPEEKEEVRLAGGLCCNLEGGKRDMLTGWLERMRGGTRDLRGSLVLGRPDIDERMYSVVPACRLGEKLD